MTDLTVITNGHWYELLTMADCIGKRGFDVSDFDYIEDDEKYNPRLFKYRGCFYDTHEFEAHDPTKSAPNHLATRLTGWHGFQSDSYFSGVAIRYDDDFELIQCALIMS
jgi:hypothetical protein